jgi:hypothetical protein
MKFRYVRLYADEQGESHFAELDVELEPTDFAPPAAPLNLASLGSATGAVVVGADESWAGDALHPAPRRQLLSGLGGEVEVTASDGESRRIGASDLLLLEDTTGKGHSSRVLKPGSFLFISLPG